MVFFDAKVEQVNKKIPIQEQSLHSEIINFFKIVAPYSKVSICSKDRLAVILVGQTLNAHALPVVHNDAVQVL